MILVTPKESSYELIDSGEGARLERFGSYVLARPDPEALWEKKLSNEIWAKADATYSRKGTSGAWKAGKTFPKNWNIEYGGLTFELRPTSFKHVGLFPEQLSHWKWLEEKLQTSNTKNQKPRVLNLFAYTGGATLSAVKAGAEVTHVDSSKVAILWARKNAELSLLKDAPVRWIEDDVLKFLKREVKRGSRYDVVIMDPPAFGHGTGGALWKIERDFYELFELVQKVLGDKPIAVIVNGYTAGYSPLTLLNNVKKIEEKYGGKTECGELAISDSSKKNLLPAGVFARWNA
ncbi:MAG: class I SAM-dependent methyltransferase [Candidatus Pacebacteria bacterium]|nr:class I SAM-dependent methyltransferase [Candidatus Paceibacterota bacterium]